MTHVILDVRRLLCPMPVIKLQNTVRNCAVGDTIKLYASDPGVLQDIPMWCRLNGHNIKSTSQDEATGDIQIIVAVNEIKASSKA